MNDRNARPNRLGPVIAIEQLLDEIGWPLTLDRRDLVAAIATVRRRHAPAPGFSFAAIPVDLGPLLVELVAELELAELEIVEALGAEICAELLWERSPAPLDAPPGALDRWLQENTGVQFPVHLGRSR